MNYKIEISSFEFLAYENNTGQLNGTIILSIFNTSVIGQSPIRKHEFSFEVSRTMLCFGGVDGGTLPPEMSKDSAGNDSELYERIAVAVNAMYAGWRQENMVMWHHTDEIGASV